MTVAQDDVLADDKAHGPGVGLALQMYKVGWRVPEGTKRHPSEL